MYWLCDLSTCLGLSGLNGATYKIGDIVIGKIQMSSHSQGLLDLEQALEKPTPFPSSVTFQTPDYLKSQALVLVT